MNRRARRKGVELTIIVNNLWNYEYKTRVFMLLSCTTLAITLWNYKYPTGNEFYSLQGAGNKWGKMAQMIGGFHVLFPQELRLR